MSNLWNELHKRAINHNGSDDSVFLRDWENRIPNYEGGCKCRSFYIIWKRQNPPTFSDYFEWSIRLHNAVNTKLNKAIISVLDARKIYE